MDKLLEALAEKGIQTDALDEDQVRGVAKAMGIDPADYLPRSVKIVPYTNKRKETNTFVSTDAFTVGRKEDGSAKTVRGLFLRVEALDQAIADLQAARGLVATESNSE